MATVSLIAVGALALLIFVLFGALLELFLDVRQLRDVAGILDRPLNIDMGKLTAARPSACGLPQLLDSANSALVLFLSEKCATCRAIAASFDQSLPSNLWIILEAENHRSASAVIESLGLNRLATG